jgi:dTDP-4-dehydrorhamnose reductase
MSNKKKLLITGAQGQLGKALVHACHCGNISYYAPLEAECNITNTAQIEELVDKNACDTIINCAAYNLVDKAEDERETVFEVNANAVGRIAEVCRKKELMFVHFSSDYVFDGRKGDLYTEDDTVCPINVYGESKVAGERYIQDRLSRFLILRLSWLFGNGTQNFIYKMKTVAEKTGVIRVSADEVSVPTSCDDVASMVLKCLNCDVCGLYHMTNTGYASRYEWCKYFFTKLGLSNVIIPVPMETFHTKAKRPPFSAMSNKKISSLLEEAIPLWQNAVERFVESL